MHEFIHVNLCYFTGGIVNDGLGREISVGMCGFVIVKFVVIVIYVIVIVLALRSISICIFYVFNPAL